MIKTELSLEVSDNSTLKVARIFDTSSYCDDEVIDNYLIEVLPPMKDIWIPFHVAKHFSLALNSSNLQYKKVDSLNSLSDLPDGIYEIKQSFRPNIYTVVQFYHFRTTELKGKLAHEWHKLSHECRISRAEYIQNRDKLREIDEYIMAAKYETENCLDKKRGKEAYEFASNLLKQYTNECQC